MTRSIRALIGVALGFFLGLSPISAQAQQQARLKTCARVDVESIAVTAELYQGRDMKTTTPTIQIAPGPSAKTMPRATQEVTLIVLGPMLGAMDSSQVKTTLHCTNQGVALIATITRAAGYHGSVLANIIWRPKIEVRTRLRKPEAIFAATWQMRLTDGTVLNHAQTPGYPDQKYPITVTKIIH